MTYLSKLALSVICFLVFLSHAEAAVLLTTFGTTNAPTFAINSSSFSTSSQSAASIQISGLDNGSSLAGFITPINITGQSSILTLSGSTSSAPTSLFNITLFDKDFKQAIYNGGTWTALTGGTASLTFLSSDAGFDFSSISAFQLDTGGTGSTINATLTGLTSSIVAAPEPSRTILGFFGLGLLAFRRRR